MLLTLMTYARLDTFRSFTVMKVEFENYMKNYEREFPNLRALKWYEETHITKKEVQEEKEKREQKATSRLSFYPFTKKKPTAKDKRSADQVVMIGKELIKVLYQDQKFYKDLQETRPDFLNDLFQAIQKAIQELPDTQGISKPADLANLDLNDPELNEVFYKILKGNKDETIEKRETEKVVQQDDLDAEDFESFDTNDGYLSLLDYINMSTKTKIKIYLASRPLLMALFGDTATVNEIISLRKALFKEIKAKRLDAKDASKIFEKNFANRLSLVLDTDFLDFSVSKTDPASYE